MNPGCRYDCAIGGISKAAQRGDIGGDLVAERKDLEYLIRLHLIQEFIQGYLQPEFSFAFQNCNFKQADSAQSNWFGTPYHTLQHPRLLS